MKLPGVEEDVGLIGIHWQGRFIELVTWNSEVRWEVDPWGRWKVSKPKFETKWHLGFFAKLQQAAAE